MASEFVQVFSESERKERTSIEMRKLKKAFRWLNKDAKKTLETLIKEAAFMAVAIEEAREIIARDGIIEPYQNGVNQQGLKKSSAVEVYDKMANTYAKIIKMICDYLPRDEVDAEAVSELTRHLVNGYQRSDPRK